VVRVNELKPFWIFTELFYPDETSSGFYLTEIAKHLSKSTQINVVCGPADYEKNSRQKSLINSLNENIKIYRVWVPPLNKNNSILRLIRLLLLSIGFSIKLLFRVKKHEKVFTVTNPAFFIPMASFIAKYKKIELIILVHDVFPENLLPIKAANPNGIFYSLNLKIFNWAYQNCTKIIVLGRDMKALFETKVNPSNKIDIIENWADVNEIAFEGNFESKSVYNQANLAGKVIIQFAGNIGRLQALDKIIDIASKCKNSIIHFVFIGEGACKKELILASKNLENVTILDSFGREQQKEYLNACDIGLVTLNDEMLGLGVPSKTYNLMAAGKPILYFGNKNSEIALMIKEYKIGWNFEISNQSEILNFFNNLKFENIDGFKAKSRIVAEKYYSKENILSKYDKYIYP
jgi:Glycosyl transferases group 1/Glycosyltransferase Family 4